SYSSWSPAMGFSHTPQTAPPPRPPQTRAGPRRGSVPLRMAKRANSRRGASSVMGPDLDAPPRTAGRRARDGDVADRRPKDIPAPPRRAPEGAAVGRPFRFDGHPEPGQRARGTTGRMDATAFKIAGRGRRAGDHAAISPRRVTPLALSWATAVSGAT